MHVILITDPGIEVDYDSFQRGLAQVTIKKFSSRKVFF
jgi:hypothetical protein